MNTIVLLDTCKISALSANTNVWNTCWEHPDENPRINPGDVHLWRLWLVQADTVVEAFARTLSPDERARADRLSIERVRRAFIISRGGLRTILSRYLGVSPHSVQFSYNTYGKPALAKPMHAQPFCFNISHSHQLALYAFAYECEIGIDVEFIRPNMNVDSIVRGFFSLHEQQAFANVPVSKRHEVFFSCWTCKEAYAKACGRGLAGTLDRVELMFDADQPPSLLSLDGVPPVGWQLKVLAPAVGYAGALVTRWETCDTMFG